ncbi:MAG: G5 domain-containing protein, partial [Anaerolineales bacterium]
MKKPALFLIVFVSFALFACSALSQLPFVAQSPVDVVKAYFAACDQGDKATALSLWSENIRSLSVSTGGNPCALSYDQKGINLNFEEGEVHGNTASVLVTAVWQENDLPNRIQTKVTLYKEKDGWRLADSSVVSSDTWSQKTAARVTIPHQEITKQASDLIEGLEYIAQKGVDGIEEGTTLTHVVDRKNVEVKRVNVTVIQPVKDQITVVGAQSKEAAREAAQIAAKAYFSAWQSGDYQALAKWTAPDTMPKIDPAFLAAQAGFVINSYDIKPVGDVQRTNFDISGTSWPAPGTESDFVLRGLIWDTPFTLEGKLTLRQDETAGWQASYWGLTGAVLDPVTMEQSYAKNSLLRVRLDHLAALTDRTFLSIELLEPSEARSSVGVALRDEFHDVLNNVSAEVKLKEQRAAVWLNGPLRPDAQSVSVDVSLYVFPTVSAKFDGLALAKTGKPASAYAPTPAVTLTPAEMAGDQTPTPWSPCSGSYPTRLWKGGYAYVNPNPPLANRMHSGLGKSYEVTGQLAPGDAVEILDGPQCADNWVWWKARALKTNLVGWTSEGDVSGYWLIPCLSDTTSASCRAALALRATPSPSATGAPVSIQTATPTPTEGPLGEFQLDLDAIAAIDYARADWQDTGYALQHRRLSGCALVHGGGTDAFSGLSTTVI